MMKAWMMIAAVGFALLASDAGARNRGKERGTVMEVGRRAGRADKQRRGGMVEPDTNQDGVVDETEAKEAAKRMIEDAKKRLDSFREKFDADGDGALNEAELKKLNNSLEERGRPAPRFLRLIDSNEDWTISAEEEEAAMDKMVQRFQNRGKKQERRQQRRGGPEAER